MSNQTETATPQLAVVICTYNRSALLLKTLASLYDCGYQGIEPIDIVVVANHCSDDTLVQLSRCRAAYPQDRLRLSWLEESKPGKSHALNAAVANTGHALLCFIDDDQIVEHGFLQHLLDGASQYPDDSIFCGRIWPAWDGSEPAWVHAREPYAIPIRPFPEFDLGPHAIRTGPDDRFPSGGNICARRCVFEQVGPFSVELGPTGHNLVGGEDHDFIRRALDKGFTIRYLPSVRQLHAIDAERMSAAYTLRKSYFRSRSSFVIHEREKKPRPYMFRKVLNHLASAVFTLNRDRRFFYLARLAASIGELAGAYELYRQSKSARRRLALPADRGMLLLEGLMLFTAVCGLLAWFISGSAHWAGLMPVMVVSGIGTVVLLAKSLFDFTQTGPRMREEISAHYGRYTLYAVARLSLWAFGLMLFLGGGGALAYYALSVTFGWQWSSLLGGIAALMGVVGITVWQFIRKLRFNPGLLVASMHYRMSRLYGLWQWATPARIRQVQTVSILLIGVLIVTTTWQLARLNKAGDLIAFWAASLFYAGLIIWAGWQPEARAPARRPREPAMRPNILMIGSDTLRADRLGALGYHRALTPHIDTLSNNGALFANCYVPCARTAPSLVSMLTGAWPHTHGIRDNFNEDEATRLKVATLPDTLRRLDYRTAAISDWCGADMGKFSFGFDYIDLPEDQWNLEYLIRQGPKDLRLFISMFTHNRLGRLLLPELYYLGGVPLTQPLGKRARRLVSRLAESEQPFFLNVFYSTTHPPFASEWPWYTRFSNPDYGGESKFAMARLTDPFEIICRQGAPKEEFDLDQIIDLYDGCVAEFDAEVGKMLAHLEACGLAASTIVVVYSDHGMEFFEHDTWGQGNSAVSDFSPRIPLLIHDPRQARGCKIDTVVRSIDIAPTLLDLVGAPRVASMDGVSLVGCMRCDDLCPELDAFNETGIWIADIPGLPEQHLRYPDLFELIEIPNRSSGTLAIKPAYLSTILTAKDRMMRRGRWKLVYQPLQIGAQVKLFDVVNDPACYQDVSDIYPDIKKEMLKTLSIWMTEKA